MARRKKAAQPRPVAPPIAGRPEAILPLTDFRGDPWGTGDPDAVAFRAGVRSSPVPAGFARKMREEGNAADIPPRIAGDRHE